MKTKQKLLMHRLSLVALLLPLTALAFYPLVDSFAQRTDLPMYLVWAMYGVTVAGIAYYFYVNMLFMHFDLHLYCSELEEQIARLEKDQHHA